MKKSFVGRSVFLVLIFLLPAAHHTLGQAHSKYIVTDQFGYLPASRKVAVIRDPKTGYDAAESFTPGATYAVVNKASGETVFSGSPENWNGGATDGSSGDKVWWFDFSAITAEGTYYVLDVDQDLRSYEFDISAEVYNEVLKHAVRAFFYQRAGFEKTAAHAGAAWADGASHLGPLQDKNARPYNETTNAAKEMDVSGGWYDAGDYNKYTNWTANYVVDFMHAYLEAPAAWADDYNIPESGNGVPDILDEARWGIDHLLRMQKADGSVLSIVGLSHASPPSAATGQSLYGTPSTSATLNTAAAFAVASKVYGARGESDYAGLLKERAIKAWDWAEANPAVIFRNNEGATAGLGAGQQETDDYGRLMAKMEAACFLFEITGDEKYRTFIDNNYADVHLMQWNWASMYEVTNQEVLLYYAALPGATPAVAGDINTTYKSALEGADHFAAYTNSTDPYLAYINNYGWGSNSLKALQGTIFTDLVAYRLDPAKGEEALTAAEGFVHYIHGVNPLNMVYLSNMYEYGGDNCANEFYHSWFANGSDLWDRVGASTYGPPPGFLTGGPNPDYDRDGCCPDNCGGSANNAACDAESLTPPKGQPDQKSYKDFNTSWPLNSWEVTENSDGYQINYIRLLSKFITTYYDCSGTKNGAASYDVCGRCSGGATGITPVTDETECETVTDIPSEETGAFGIYPNPATGTLYIKNERPGPYRVEVVTTLGKPVLSVNRSGPTTINIQDQPPGVLVVIVYQGRHRLVKKVVKL